MRVRDAGVGIQRVTVRVVEKGNARDVRVDCGSSARRGDGGAYAAGQQPSVHHPAMRERAGTLR